MKKRLALIITVLAALIMMGLTGCKDKTGDTESDTVKTDAEYKQQAEKEITKDNLLEELEKEEKSHNQETQ